MRVSIWDASQEGTALFRRTEQWLPRYGYQIMSECKIFKKTSRTHEQAIGRGLDLRQQAELAVQLVDDLQCAAMKPLPPVRRTFIFADYWLCEENEGNIKLMGFLNEFFVQS